MNKRRHRLPIVLLLLFVLLLAACSNDDDDAGGQGETKTTTEDGGGGTTDSDDQFADLKKIAAPNPCTNDPGITATEIKVGGLMPLSGVRAQSFSAANDGIKARFEKANAENELGSRKINYKPLDDTSDAARNAEVARQLVESEKVFGIVEVSDQSDGSSQYLKDQAIPVAGWHVGRPHWSTMANFFALRASTAADPDKEYSSRNVDVVKELGGAKLALVGGGNQASAGFINKLERAANQLDSGVEVVYKTVDVVSGDTNFTAIVQRIKESGADSVYTGMDLLQNTALSKQLKDAGVVLKAIVFPGGYDPRVTGLPGMEDAVFGLEFIPFELKPPSFVEFDKWLPKTATRGQISYLGWLSAEMFLQGIKEAGVECPTRKAFINNLRLLDSYTANGAFEPQDLSKNFGREFQCVYYVQVKNKAFTPLFDGKEFCGKPVIFK